MADYRAVSAVCEAVMQLLRGQYKPELFDSQEFDFAVSQAADLALRTTGGKTGISLFLFYISQNTQPRSSPGPIRPGGRQSRPSLMLDLQFLLTAWASDVQLQQEITGWMIQVLENNPILPSQILNKVLPGTFLADETVAIMPLALSNEDLLRIWEKTIQKPYCLSIPYLARVVLT